MRCFVALNLSAEVRKNIESFISKLPRSRGVKLVPPGNLHVTLEFLGELTRKDCDDLIPMLKLPAEKTAPFQLSFHGIGAFPNQRSPQVLWLGMERLQTLMNLAREVKDIAKVKNSKPFTPHLTIGRVKFKDGDFNQFYQQFFAEKQTDFGTMAMTSFSLMQSDLSRGTPVYTELERFVLAGNEA